MGGEDTGQRDIRTNRTLTERVARVEQILSLSGFGGVEYPEEYAEAGGAVGREKLHAIRDRESGCAGFGNEKTQRATTFEEITQRILMSTDRVTNIAHNLEKIGTRVFGPLPAQPGSDVDEMRQPDCTVDQTFYALNALDQALARLHSAAARLEGI